jgi:hypothetical protein
MQENPNMLVDTTPKNLPEAPAHIPPIVKLSGMHSYQTTKVSIERGGDMREMSEKKIEKALRYKELLEKVEEAKKRCEKRKFLKECGVSSLNRLKQKYDKEGFLGLIDRRNGNPKRNNEAHELVKKKFLETGFNGEKLR